MSAKPTLVVASSNQHKIRELQHIFGDYYTVVSMVAAGFNAPIEETATTFAGNAAIKAETVSAATGLPTLADDSGLSVEVLDGDPGVYSARYAMMAGEGSGDAANNALLLRRMKARLTAPARSSARWRSRFRAGDADCGRLLPRRTAGGRARHGRLRL